MKFTETPLKGAFVIELEPIEDNRGFFARTCASGQFLQYGLETHWVEFSTSFTKKEGTRRGMHYQAAPFAEDKLVRCTSGAIHDVIVDLRPPSPTFKQWYAVELTAKNRKQLYVPKMFAHGFQTLEDNTEVFYQMSEFHHPEAAREIPCDSPGLKIVWPERNIWATIPTPLSHPW